MTDFATVQVSTEFWLFQKISHDFIVFHQKRAQVEKANPLP